VLASCSERFERSKHIVVSAHDTLAAREAADYLVRLGFVMVQALLAGPEGEQVAGASLVRQRQGLPEPSGQDASIESEHQLDAAPRTSDIAAKS